MTKWKNLDVVRTCTHRVNMKAHWKLLTFMIGGNDFCSDICYQTNATQWMNESQEKYLIKTLRFLRDNMPRLVKRLTSHHPMISNLKIYVSIHIRSYTICILLNNNIFLVIFCVFHFFIYSFCFN